MISLRSYKIKIVHHLFNEIISLWLIELQRLKLQEKNNFHVLCEKFPFQNAEFENDHAEKHVLKIDSFLKKNGYADTIGCYLVFIS